MNLHSPQLERRLKKAVSEGVRRGGKQRHRRPARVLATFRREILPGGFWRLFLSGWLIGTMALGATYQLSMGYRLAVLALWSFVAAVFVAGQLESDACGDPQVQPLLLLPVPDDEIFRWRTQGLLRRSLPHWIDSAAAFSFLAVISNGSVFSWLSVLVFATAQWLLILALATILAAYPIRSLRRFGSLLPVVVVLALFVLVVDRRFVGPHLARGIDAAAPWIGVLLPTGWPGLMFDRGVLQHDWIALPVILPIALLAAWGFHSWRQLKRSYSLDIASFNGGVQIDEEEWHQPDGETARPSGPTEVVDEIRTGSFLRPHLQLAEGPLERLADRLLTDRERLLLAAIGIERLGWSDLWRKAAMVLGVATLAAWTLQRIGMSWFGWLDAIGVLVAACMTLPSGVQVNARFLTSLPVKVGEIARLKGKFALIRCFSAMVLFTSYGAVLAWRLGESPITGALVGAKAILLILAVMPVLTASQVSGNDTRTIRFRSVGFIALLLVGVIAILALGLAALAVDFSGEPVWLGILLALATYGVAWAMLKAYEWSFNRGRADIISDGG